MFLLPRVGVGDVAAVVCRHEIEAAVNIYSVRVIKDDHTLAHMFARQAVMVFEKRYIAVLADCHLFHYLQLVAGEVDIHLVGGVMLDVSHHIGMEPVLPDSAFSTRTPESRRDVRSYTR